jgi:enterochelin esterase-like enzyme
MKTGRAVLPLTALLASLSLAQTPPPDSLTSPEVHADRTVTFRVRAPKAGEVTLSGDWLAVGKTQPMTKGADGIWSITTEPLEANGHLYWFNLDGLAVADPINPVIKMRQRTSASLVEVPAAPPAPWELRDVPHGTVVTEWQKSAVLGRTERIVLYLPPGYEKSSAKYPVLYLVHGSGDVPESWTAAGHANLILDNLIADKKATPMIVVMPAGHAVPFSAGRGGQVKNMNNNELFEQYLVKDVIPAIEGKYRIAAGSKNRALAGLSMGGGHTIYTGFSHPELFSALGIFSPGLPRDFDTKFKGVLTDPKSFNSKVSTVWIACGDNDTTVQYPRIKTWAESLDKAGIHENFKTYSGAHTWPVWRNSLADFAPMIFTKK